jgi:agmatine/peptidylarginine deiminase
MRRERLAPSRNVPFGHAVPFGLALALTLSLAAMLPTGATPPAWAERSVDGDEELLPIGETPEEIEFRARYQRKAFMSDPPPVAPIRNCAEFEPCTGALIRYPLGVPYNLIHELTDDVIVHVIVSSTSYSTAVANFVAQGVDTSRVEWVVAPNNSIWTRDYGPWFVFDGNGDQVILDHFYNRPARPDDNQIPAVLGGLWGIPVVTHDLWHTGGNYMTEGHGLSYSTDLVWNENLSMTHQQIAQFMNDYYGVDPYNVLPDISTAGIHHIDTWGKLLDEETVLVKEVATNHADYPELEANAATIAGLTNKYGRPFRVVRVFCHAIQSGGVAAYTNSLILNGKVLVPMFNNATRDSAALNVYRANMPGYEAIGFSYSGWLTDDALHCRVMGIADRYMLRVDHNPVQRGIETLPVDVRVFIDDRSEAGLNMTATGLHWRVVGSPTYTDAALVPDAEPDWYVGQIPGQAAGTEVEYYVTAADLTGRTASRPRTAPAAAIRFAFEAVTGVPAPGDRRPADLALDAPLPNPFAGATALRFRLASPGVVRLTVFDTSGRAVARLVDGPLGAGPHEARWDGRSEEGARVAAGVYLFVLDAQGERHARRAVLLR